LLSEISTQLNSSSLTKGSRMAKKIHYIKTSTRNVPSSVTPATSSLLRTLATRFITDTLTGLSWPFRI